MSVLGVTLPDSCRTKPNNHLLGEQHGDTRCCKPGVWGTANSGRMVAAMVQLNDFILVSHLYCVYCSDSILTDIKKKSTLNKLLVIITVNVI